MTNEIDLALTAGLESGRDTFLAVLNKVIPYSLAVVIAVLVISMGIKWFLSFLGHKDDWYQDFEDGSHIDHYYDNGHEYTDIYDSDRELVSHEEDD